MCVFMNSPLIQKLDEIERRAKAVNDISEFTTIRVGSNDILKLTQALRTSMDAMYDSIARADDGGDSYNSRPIRNAVKEIEALYVEKGTT